MEWFTFNGGGNLKDYIYYSNQCILFSLLFIFVKSEECREAIYAAKWFGNKRLMTAIIIILSQKPLSLTACNFSVVSVDIFQAVCKFSH